MEKKLAIVSTHPIQYYAPVFRLLAEKTELKVFYTWGEESLNKVDPGFGKKIEWDLPLLDGYKYEFLKNTSKRPGSSHFKGIINPHAIDRIREYNPNAILIYGWAYQSHLCIMRHFKGKIPIWFRGDSHLLNETRGVKKYLRRFFLRWVYAHVDKAFYVGSANKAYFKQYGLKDKQLIHAPHAIDNQRFSENRNSEANALRNELGIEKEDILILFAGKFELQKNPELLLSAFIELNIHDTHLLMVGNGVLEEKLKRKVETIKQGKPFNNIHFLPFQNQSRMPFIYQACNLFCLPSQSETWGLAVNEAMAAGKAVLVSNRVGCATDLVKSGVNGEVFQAGNIENLKIKLRGLLTDREKLFRYGEASKQQIKDWSFEQQMQAIFSQLVLC